MAIKLRAGIGELNLLFSLAECEVEWFYDEVQVMPGAGHC